MFMRLSDLACRQAGWREIIFTQSRKDSEDVETKRVYF